MTEPRPTHRIPEIIAHRGASRERRENTLAAFARALELGADAIELDVHATADGVVVVHHDPVLGAATGALAGAAIAKLTLPELRRAGKAPEVAVPTLAEVLALVAERAVVYVEIKGTGIERLVVDAIAAAPRARCAVHSFDHRIVRYARELSSSTSGTALPVGILMVSRPIDPVAAMRAAGARDLWQHWELLDEELVRAVHGAGGRVVAWTVNDAGDAARFAAMGVDGLCTDVPDVVRAALQR
jgi:glycerophosphoryl diester phosphodiesterase